MSSAYIETLVQLEQRVTPFFEMLADDEYSSVPELYEEDCKKIFANNVLFLRAYLGLIKKSEPYTQGELSELLLISGATLKKWERASGLPQRNSLVAFLALINESLNLKVQLDAGSLLCKSIARIVHESLQTIDSTIASARAGQSGGGQAKEIDKLFERFSVLMHERDLNYRRLIEASPDPVIVVNEGKIRYCNPAAWRFFGATGQEELAGRFVMDFVDKDSWRGDIKVTKGIFEAEERPQLIEVTFVRLNDVPVHSELAITTVLFEGQSCLQMIIRDMSGRKRTEERLRRLTSDFHAVVSAWPDLYFQLTADAVVVDFLGNESVPLYRRPAEFLGRPVDMVLPPEAGRKIREAVHLCATERTRQYVTYSIVNPETGVNEFFEAAIVPSQGTRILGIVRNVTQRKQLEEECTRLRLMLRSFVESIPAPSAVIDGTYRFTSVNASFEKYFGYRAQEILGTSLFALIAKEDAEKVRSVLLAQRTGDAEKSVMELTLRTIDDREITTGCLAALFQLAPEEPIHHWITFSPNI